MSYKEKPQLKLYSYSNNEFILQAIIDDYAEVSFEHNLFQAGVFTISINYNIPNSQLFQRGLFIQFGNNPYDFGEIYSIQDSIGEDGKGSQIRTITGYDARYILKRRVIKNMNSNGLWVMTAKGELCLRNLIKDQCGSGAEAKRQLPINNVIPASADAIGKEYSVSENFSNLYEVCKTIATQSEIGWRIAFENGALNLEVYAGQNLSQTVRFDTNYESLANGEFSDSSESFSNAIYIGGKGQNDNRDIYEGEDGTPSGFDRFESWDNQSSMTTESEYEAEALSMLSQYGQTLTMQGNGLAKCPYIFREQYDIGDIITVAFSGKSAVAQILSVTEHWAWGSYDIQFSFGKPQNNLAEQLQLMLRQIQKASEKASSTDSVRWYTIPTDTEMPKADVTYNTIGFIGDVGSGATFTLYLDNEKTGAKTYHVWFKQLAGSGKLTFTTGKQGAVNLTMGVGTYVAIISVDEAGNIIDVASTPINAIQSGNMNPVTSNAVAGVIDKINYSASARDIDTLYPSENGKCEVFGGNFTGNVPISNRPTAILRTFRVLRSVSTEADVQIYQEWEAFGTEQSGYSPNKYIRFGYFYSGVGTSPTWSGWQKVISSLDVFSGNMNNKITNYNNALNNGFYYVNGDTVNCPPASLGFLGYNGDGALFVQRYDDNWICQICQDFRGNGGLYVRSKNNGTWGSWSRVSSTNWERLLTFSTDNYFEGKLNGNDKILRGHFNGYAITTLTFGASIGVLPTSYAPSTRMCALIDADVGTSGRVPCIVLINTDRNIRLYPIIQNQYTGSISNVQLYGDVLFYLV